MRKVLILGAALCALALAQQLAKVFDPPLRAVIHAEYSDQARLARLTGTVMLSAVIGRDGKASDIHVVNSLGLGLDESAVKAAADWQFTPRPVPVELLLECGFQMPRADDQWSMGHAQFSVPEGASQPVLLQTQFSAPRSLKGSVRVAFEVDAQGVPAHIQIEASSDPALDDEVIALIREWRFQAAMRNGIPVEAHAELDLTRGLNVRVAPGQIAAPKQVPIQVVPGGQGQGQGQIDMGALPAQPPRKKQ